MRNKANEAHAHKKQDPKECGNHRDGDSGEKVEPGVVAVIVVVG